MVEVVQAAVLLVALVGLLKIAVPPLAFSLGLVRLRIRTDEDPRGAQPHPDDASYRRRFEQFTALGFKPVGTARETCWFVTPFDWLKSWDSCWMAAPDGRTLVSFHRLTAEEPVRFGAVTLLEGGDLVRTSCPGTKGAQMPGVEGYHRTEVRGVEPADLLARHEEQVAAVSQRRGRAVISATLRETNAAEEKFEALIVPAIDQSGSNTIIKIAFGVPLLVTLVIQALVVHGALNLTHLAFGICAGAVTCEWTVRAVVRESFRQAVLDSHQRTPGPDPISTKPPGEE